MPPKPDAVKEIYPDILPGYLPLESLPNGLALIPLPPKKGSKAEAFDQEVNQQWLKLKGSERWKLAIQNAELKFPHAAGVFSCTLGVEITEQSMPNIYCQQDNKSLQIYFLLMAFIMKPCYNRRLITLPIVQI